jgi:hypothetical protein
MPRAQAVPLLSLACLQASHGPTDHGRGENGTDRMVRCDKSREERERCSFLGFHVSDEFFWPEMGLA